MNKIFQENGKNWVVVEITFGFRLIFEEGSPPVCKALPSPSKFFFVEHTHTHGWKTVMLRVNVGVEVKRFWS